MSGYIRARLVMTSENCSPAVASRCAKYFDEFRASTLLGAQPRSHKIVLAADAQIFPMAVQDYTQLFQREGLHASPRTLHAFPESYVQPSSENF
jgi:hypothetical protein